MDWMGCSWNLHLDRLELLEAWNSWRFSWAKELILATQCQFHSSDCFNFSYTTILSMVWDFFARHQEVSLPNSKSWPTAFVLSSSRKQITFHVPYHNTRVLLSLWQKIYHKVLLETHKNLKIAKFHYLVNRL